jgi:hypothetical protein
MVVVPLNEKINPILINGNDEDSYTVMYFSHSINELKPYSESKGLLFISPQEVQLICNNQITLSEFLEQNGRVIIKDNINKDLFLELFPQLLFLSKLLSEDFSYIETQNYSSKNK